MLQKLSVRESEISRQTVSRYLQEKKYRYFQFRKKGLLSPKDLTTRLKFANQCKIYPQVSGQKVCHSTFMLLLESTKAIQHPMQKHFVRDRGERRAKACCAKGKNEGSPGIVPKFMVAVSHSKGIIKCYHYEGGTNGEKIVNLIEGQFPNLFVEEHFWKKCLLFFQDSDPSQNCKKSREAMEEVGCRLFKIPACSLDLNSIENAFHLIDNKLKWVAVSRNLTKETFREFLQ